MVSSCWRKTNNPLTSKRDYNRDQPYRNHHKKTYFEYEIIMFHSFTIWKKGANNLGKLVYAH